MKSIKEPPKRLKEILFFNLLQQTISKIFSSQVNFKSSVLKLRNYDEDKPHNSYLVYSGITTSLAMPFHYKYIYI